ncbi:PIG-L deacetylase family protein [Smaragdicoccus niigatensis]|uniref:PIG-L deacetylase family protein n=1 Tax=Smaragdicoccus niigatensis TaxID=359359 RepID=UPI000382511A|nr:PIG-L family deacetylase [Smaragdicoccus niigatensis]
MSDSRTLIVSPHLDDAALSVSHVLQRGNATVVTIFAGDPPAGIPLSTWDIRSGARDAIEHMEVRRAEDRNALAVYPNVDVIHWNYVDNQYRTEPLSIPDLTSAIDELAADFDECWFPAGIGRHPDHVAVATACADVEAQGAFTYADLPYAHRSARLRHGAVEVALDDAQANAKQQSCACYQSQLAGLRESFPRLDTVNLRTEWFWEGPISSPPPGLLASLLRRRRRP